MAEISTAFSILRTSSWRFSARGFPNLNDLDVSYSSLAQAPSKNGYHYSIQLASSKVARQGPTNTIALSVWALTDCVTMVTLDQSQGSIERSRQKILHHPLCGDHGGYNQSLTLTFS